MVYKYENIKMKQFLQMEMFKEREKAINNFKIVNICCSYFVRLV